MIERIVTVTNSKDLYMMIRQAESIQKFVDPCEHLVIIEDRFYDRTFWYNTLKKYYTNHKLVVKSYNDVFPYMNGWIRQQILKLYVALRSKNKYLVLDSKDFFVRPTELGQWNDFVASNGLVTMEEAKGVPNYGAWPYMASVSYSLYFDVPMLDTFFSPVTPFVIDTKNINRDTLQDDINAFARFNSHCEFLFYTYMAPHLIENFTPHKFSVYKIWSKWSADVLRQKINLLTQNFNDDENLMVVGIHRNVIQSCDYREALSLNKWIRSLGLTTNI